ncbi:hypothetical protein CDD83_6551 [Cordyceps sp. RAO-2017]|nr:hypothetical protein CDD83_6551 [Cordyceps sp. RAO-2017]
MEPAKQLSPLPGFKTIVTGHDASGASTISEQGPSPWRTYANGDLQFAVPYTTSDSPADMNGDGDVRKHRQLMEAGRLGLVNPRGTVCRVVDFAPGEGVTPLMHRTQSLDYGIVLEGEMELLLDAERATVRRGDVVVQRATMHAWKNVSRTEWARMLFVLIDAAPLQINGKLLGEDLGQSSDITARDK